MQSACAVLYCHLCPVRFYNIFPHYLINGTIFGKTKMLLDTKCVFWFSLQLLPETFLVLRKIQRKIAINVHRSSCKMRSCVINHFNNNVSTFRYWFRQIGIRDHVAVKSASPLSCSCADHSHLIQELPFIKWGWLFSCFQECLPFVNYLMLLMLPKDVCLLLNIMFHTFYALWVCHSFIAGISLSSWNQISVRHWKFIPMFVIPICVTVLFVAVHHEYEDCCESRDFF
jgi:hypothetical protein